MKNYLFCLLFLLCFQMNAQYGDETSSAIASVDFNDSSNNRTMENTRSYSSNSKSAIVTDENNAKSTNQQNLIGKSLLSCIKGKFSTGGLVNLSLATGVEIIPFDMANVDLNNEFDTNTHTFTASEDGIYDVTLQLEVDNTADAPAQFGVSILKNGIVINRSIYENTGSSVDVSSSRRKSQTLTRLATGDTVSFQIEGSIERGAADLTDNENDSYFTIQQIR